MGDSPYAEVRLPGYGPLKTGDSIPKGGISTKF
jgi:hypothetical protein